MARYEPRRVALIPGDGIGQEVVPAAQRVLMALDLPLTYIKLDAGFETFRRTGTALPWATQTALQSCDGAIFGAVSSPSTRVEGYTSPILTLRKAFGLYANLRPVVSMPVPSSQPSIDLLIVRENTECLYVRRETLSEDGERAVAERVITRKASERIARMAFEQARRRAKADGRATIVHKANVLTVTDGLFRETALKVAGEYPDVAVEDQIVDSMIYRLIREPQRYDVIVAPNLYGDILSDAAAALVGGLGLAPSANVGERFILVEPVHGSAPDIAGRDIANPVATILAAAMLLDHFGWREEAISIGEAVESTLGAGILTPELGGSASTEEVTEAVARVARLRHQQGAIAAPFR